MVKKKNYRSKQIDVDWHCTLALGDHKSISLCFLQFKFFQEPKIQHQKSSQSKVLTANDSFNASLGIFMSRLLLDKQGTLQEIVQLFLCKKTIPVVSFEKMDRYTIQIQCNE